MDGAQTWASYDTFLSDADAATWGAGGVTLRTTELMGDTHLLSEAGSDLSGHRRSAHLHISQIQLTSEFSK